MGWPFDAASTARTAYIGKLTNKLIYEQLPPGVLEDLRKKNPVDTVTKRRKRKHFQHLTEDVGDPHVDKQINAVTTLLRATANGQWKFFQMLFNQAFPPIQADLFLADEIERLEISGPKEEAANRGGLQRILISSFRTSCSSRPNGRASSCRSGVSWAANDGDGAARPPWPHHCRAQTEP